MIENLQYIKNHFSKNKTDTFGVFVKITIYSTGIF